MARAQKTQMQQRKVSGEEKRCTENLQLLIDGTEAFPEILRCIESARRSIRINMFIWRDDVIGNRVAQAVLDAADRGVAVKISVDRYGVVLEKAEECKRSFFHKRQSVAEKVKTKALELFYPMEGAIKGPQDRESDLYRAIMAHPNIRLSRDVFKADHSKFYIFDEETVIMGGINIEDKENGADLQGRVYQDYMVKLQGRQFVEALLSTLDGCGGEGEERFFGANIKEPVHRFDMERLYLSMIDSAREELVITMAYFSPLPQFIDAIVAAHRRGVRVSVLVPERANFQSDSNLAAVRRLLQLSGNGIRVYLSPKMVHTKLVANEEWVSFGSTNITKKAFGQLSELNFFCRRKDSPFARELMDSVQREQSASRCVEDFRAIRHSALRAWVEGFLV